MIKVWKNLHGDWSSKNVKRCLVGARHPIIQAASNDRLQWAKRIVMICLWYGYDLVMILAVFSFYLMLFQSELGAALKTDPGDHFSEADRMAVARATGHQHQFDGVHYWAGPDSPNESLSGILSKLNQYSLAGPFKHTVAPFIGILALHLLISISYLICILNSHVYICHIALGDGASAKVACLAGSPESESVVQIGT